MRCQGKKRNICVVSKILKYSTLCVLRKVFFCCAQFFNARQINYRFLRGKNGTMELKRKPERMIISVFWSSFLCRILMYCSISICFCCCCCCWGNYEKVKTKKQKNDKGTKSLFHFTFSFFWDWRECRVKVMTKDDSVYTCLI